MNEYNYMDCSLSHMADQVVQNSSYRMRLASQFNIKGEVAFTGT